VSDCCLTPNKPFLSSIVHCIYHDENKLHFDEMMMISALLRLLS
jgi:hypothetical protein